MHPEGDVTTTDATPAEPGGVVMTIDDPMFAVMVAAAPPMVTVVPGTKFAPATTNGTPPLLGPEAKSDPATSGAGLKGKDAD